MGTAGGLARRRCRAGLTGPPNQPAAPPAWLKLQRWVSHSRGRDRSSGALHWSAVPVAILWASASASPQATWMREVSHACALGLGCLLCQPDRLAEG